MAQKRNKITLKTTSEYPCQYDDIIDMHKRTYATIYILSNAKKDGKTEAGITICEDGIYDIVIDAQKLTKKVVFEALKDLSKITGLEYKLEN